MGREASVSYFTAEAKKCACSQFVEEGKDCCQDEHDVLKLEDSQKTFSSFVLPVPELTLLGDLYSVQIAHETPPGAHAAVLAESPPKILYRVHCSFVFYEEESIA